MLLPGWLGVLQGDLIIPAQADGRLCAESAGALKSDQGRHWPDICLSWNINRRIMSRTPAGSSHNLMKSVSVMWICNEKQTALSARNQRSSNIRLRLIRTTQHTLRTKSISKHSFLVLQLSQIGVSFQYLEGPTSTWKDQDSIFWDPLASNIPVLVLPGTDWSFQILKWLPYLWHTEAPKKVLGSTFCPQSADMIAHETNEWGISRLCFHNSQIH